MPTARDDYIEIVGARENNLKNISLNIPKHKITVFTGVSGSGKSSIVFDTLATEAQRQLNENFSMFVRNILPHYPQPDADAIRNLNMSIVVDQRPLGGGARSTVGTITDIATLLRLLYSQVGKPQLGSATMFSFNDPAGMCPECSGLGSKMGVDARTFIDMEKSLNEGALRVPALGPNERGLYAASGFFDNDKKIKDYTAAEMELLLHGKDRKFKLQIGGGTVNATYEGVIERFTRAYIRRDISTLSKRTQELVSPYIVMGLCTLCRGARLNQAALSCKIQGHNIAELSAMEIDELVGVVKKVNTEAVKPIIATLLDRLQDISDIGLGYLSLDRKTDTLSGGEAQRVKIVKHLSSSLVDVMYIFDEPSVGLHPRDVHRVNELLTKLRNKGNTVIVVDHDPDVIKVADHVIDVGPHAGKDGGMIMYEGTFGGLLKSGTLTGEHMKHTVPLNMTPRAAKGNFSIANATINNLQDVNITIPQGVLTVVTGVAGSGKSSLINQIFVPEHPEAIVINQAPIGTSTRSNPATYTGIMDITRLAFASANNVDAGMFSFNSKGACENCQGLGFTYTDLGFLDGIKVVCDVCEGRRFKDEVLAYTLKGKTISDVLNMTIAQALDYYDDPIVITKLQAMRDVGLSYLPLGQPLSTLSGGECQRIKLSSELHKQGSLYVMDEPTTGLHMSDINVLLAIMNQLVDAGNTVIVIEHNLDVIRAADWIIDMGPEAGSKGGQVVFEGVPAKLVKDKHSLTAKYM